MRGLLVALALVVGGSATAYAATGLSMQRAEHVAGKVKHREARNVFHLRERMGGAFRLHATTCERDQVDLGRVVCSWQAVSRAVDDAGYRMSCTVDVTVRSHGRHEVRWSRRVEACATAWHPNP